MALCGRYARWQGSFTYRRADNVTKAASGASVAVRAPGTATLLPIYSDTSGTVQANPITLDANAYAAFYVDKENCKFDLLISPATTEFTAFTRANVSANLSDTPAEFNVLDYGVTGNGTTDDEPALNDLIDLVAATTLQRPARIIFPKADYLAGRRLVPDGEGLVGQIVRGISFIGDGARIIAKTTTAGGVWTTDDAIFRFRHETVLRQDFRFEGLTLEGQAFGDGSGPGSDPARITGIRTTRIDRLKIRDVTVQNLGSSNATIADRFDAILLGDAVGGSRGQATNVQIQGLTVDTVARNGISGLDVEHLTVRDSHFDACQNSGIDIEPNLATQRARDVRIKDSDFTECEVIAIVMIPGSSIRGVLHAEMADALVEGCHFYGGDITAEAVRFHNWQAAKVRDCHAYRVTDFGFGARSCEDIEFIDCHVEAMTTTADAKAYAVDSTATVQSKRVDFKGNHGVNLRGYGLQIVDLDGGIVIGNEFDDFDNAAGSRDGISLGVGTLVCRRVTLMANQCYNGAGVNCYGIDIEAGVTDTIIGGNTCLGNVGGQIRDAGTRTRRFGDVQQIDRGAMAVYTLLGQFAGTGHTAADHVAGEFTIANGAAGPTAIVSNVFNTGIPGGAVYWTAKNTNARTMGFAQMLATKTASGFDVTHPTNSTGGAAIFGFWIVSD